MKISEVMAQKRSSASKTLIIQPSVGWIPVNFRELWDSRELLLILALREIKVRYRQTALGVSWAILQPLFTMLIFSLFFGRLAKMPSDHVPYPVFALAALVPWTFFSTALSQTSNCLVNNAHLVSKIYFPRLILPLASVLAALVDFGFAFLLLIGMLFYYRVTPGVHTLYIFGFLLLACVTSLAAGLMLSATNVAYRDVRTAVPFLVQLWMFATPIAYPSSLIREPWRTVYGLNPMVGVADGFRWALLGSTGVSPSVVFASCLAACLGLVFSVFYFCRTEKRFADII